MANNELDEILAEIRQKAQESNAAAQQAQEDELPVDVIDRTDGTSNADQESVFSDILKAVGAVDAKKTAAAVPQPETAPEPETAITEVLDDTALPEEPESMFTFVDDAAEPTPAEEGAEEVTPSDEAGDAAEADAPVIGEAPAEEAPAEAAEDVADGDKPKNGNKKPLIIALICVIVIAALVGVYFGFFHHKKAEPTTASQPAVSESVAATETTAQPVGTVNPLTGESDFNQAAIGKRPVAVVVENEYDTKAIRPQWGIEEADMIMEAETEYSTRMLFFWADYTALPEKIGPARSARPPFIHFAQLYDAVYIHAGLSHSKGNYVGADSVFENEGIDHINLLSQSEDGNYFGRDKSRTSTIEHTGYLNGKNAAELIEKQGFRTDLDTARLTQFTFNEKAEATGTMDAKTVGFVWSNRARKHAKFTFDETNGVYRTADFDEQGREADLRFETVMLLLDETEYVTVENYKGSQSETYCNYKLSGGKGLVASEGKATEVTWSVENGKIVMKDDKGEAIKLNPGKIYIGYGSSNNGGSYSAEG